jgi:hypothetical protein
MHGDVGDVHLVGDLPDADVADDTLGLARDVAASDAVLLDLVEERSPRPGHGEGGALDGQHLVQVGRPHPFSEQRRHDV